ncbi:MAG: mechanosensitive ion channel [Bradyrhizobiaceae bacterium]|jgi:small conductance mechanosensitive channel|nr:MAG: mechanosensitive ion channel [Bradyrhizobiaceae bacterium]
MTVNFETLWASLLLYGLNAIYAGALLAIGFYVSGAADRIVTSALSHTRRIDPLVSNFVASLARYGVLAVVGIAVLQLFGIQTASLVAVLGAASLAIGLALQGTLTNLAAGVMLLLFRPFKIGDTVEVGGKAGTVTSLSLFMTELKTGENVQILLPNGSVWGSAIINRSTYPGAVVGKVEVSFPVRAGREAQMLGQELIADLVRDSRVQHDPAPQAKVSKVVNLADGDGVVELTVAATTDLRDVDAVKSKLLEAINTYIAARPSGWAKAAT